MELQFRQLRTLVHKNLLLLTSARTALWGTIVTALVLPIVLSAFLTVVVRAFLPNANYGIGAAYPIRSLSDAMGLKPGPLVLLNNASSVNGDIDNIISTISTAPRNAGREVIVASSDDELRVTCRSNFRGVSKCFAAVVFQSSPTEGPGGVWNYTLRAGAALGSNPDVDKDNNDLQIYILPLQHTIDSAISNLNLPSNSKALSNNVQASIFTSKTEERRRRDQTRALINANINAIAVVWLITLLSPAFNLVSLMAKERETGMSDLIESVMPNQRRWEPQAIRLASLHLSFDIVYIFSWIFVGAIFRVGYFKYTSHAVTIIGFVLGGLAFVSFSVIGGSFFKRAQLSGIIVIGVAILLGVAAQLTAKSLSDAAMAITSLIFAPMALVNFIVFCCHWEYESLAVNLVKRAPNSHSSLPGIVFIIFFILQIFMYPLLGSLVERWLYGTAAGRKGRDISKHSDADVPPVVVTHLSKIYKHSLLWNTILKLFGKSTEPVYAVEDLSLSALKGQIMVLVGANGCGKTTTLNAIAGLHNMTSGNITVDGSGGIGICPQKNVLWNPLTVRQHAIIFNRLKTVSKDNLSNDLDMLYKSCALGHKVKSPSKTLSGGQKRKLQLLMMLTGGSQVCCVDEASGGLDPLSRRMIWDILLAERGRRTVILTTHFLDEAEFLADKMVIMSKGVVGAEGSVSELKSKLGNGYRVQIRTPKHNDSDDGVAENEDFDEGETFENPSQALTHVKGLESHGITNYQIAGPTIEEVFMKLAADPDSEYQDYTPEAHSAISRGGPGSRETAPNRKRVGAFKQVWILFLKRLTVWRRNPFPLLFTFILPIVAAGLLIRFIKNVENPGCSIAQQFSISDIQSLSTSRSIQLVFGPTSAVNADAIALVSGLIPNTSSTNGQGNTTSSLLDKVHIVNSLDEFNSYIRQNFSSINPGGVFLGDSSSPPTFSSQSDYRGVNIFTGIFVQNLLDVLLTNTKIITQYAPFDITFPSGTGDTLQFLVYLGLVYGAFPAFFTLYPTQERVRNVRAMEYSNGVRPLPLWTAYTLFDWFNTIISSVIITVIFAAATGAAWYNLGYMFLVLILYTLASILLGYMISKVAKSHFSAFAFSAGGQCVMFLIYLSAFWSIQVQSDPADVDRQVKIAYYVIGVISPMAQLLKALFVGLNLFSILCVGSPPAKSTNPGSFDLYGGPIFFLILQSVVMFSVLVWWDHQFSFGRLKKHRHIDIIDLEKTLPKEVEVVEEEARVANSHDGLKVIRVDKVYRSITRPAVHAVDDLTFGVKSGEVFALVGPNGAGKSTTISMLRGEIRPTGKRGELFIQDIPVLDERYKARFHLGVCPQFDAIDTMSVREHLAFYARVRGVRNIPDTVEAMIRSVGLQPFADRMADKLSGGNKRKLSLAMALIGNPEVVLLDEPSSGMDPVAKRNMWKTLAKFRPGRSILLTTHSMEEADALASRVGVIAKRLLDIGTTSHLREKHGHGFHVHVVMKTAPNTTDDEIASLQSWIEQNMPGIERQGIPYHGQIRYNVPIKAPVRRSESSDDEDTISTEKTSEIGGVRTVGSLFSLLEENKEALGIEFYSVSPSTFDEVFLKVIDKNDVVEEEIHSQKSSWLKSLFRKKKEPFPLRV